MSKNIVICCDATNNQITSPATNVLRLFRMLVRSSAQFTYYDGGVGTLADPMAITRTRRLVRKHLDSAIGYSLRDNFCEAYRYLSRVYQPDDRIFLFGFSRGAYTVRALAGALHMLGLARQEHDNLVPYAWAAYSDDDRTLKDEERFGGANRFKKVFGALAPVHFVGVWDTVSSYGFFWDYRALPYTANNGSINCVRHAMAIDERRVCFPCNLFGIGGAAGAAGVRDWKQVWFAGVHSDVGGGYSDDVAGLSKVALQWMVHEALHQGLLVDPAQMDDMLGFSGNRSKPDPLGPIHESLTAKWWPLELLPRRCWRRDRTKKGEGKMAMQWPHLGKRRQIPDGAVVHESVKTRMESSSAKYQPRNLPRHVTFVGDSPSPALKPEVLIP